MTNNNPVLTGVPVTVVFLGSWMTGTVKRLQVEPNGDTTFTVEVTDAGIKGYESAAA